MNNITSKLSSIALGLLFSALTLTAQLSFDGVEPTHNTIAHHSNFTGLWGYNFDLGTSNDRSYTHAGIEGAGWGALNALAWNEDTDEMLAHFNNDSHLTKYTAWRDDSGAIQGFSNTGNFGQGFGQLNAIAWLEGTERVLTHFGTQNQLLAYDYNGTTMSRVTSGDVVGGGWGGTNGLGLGADNTLVAHFGSADYVASYIYNPDTGGLQGNNLIEGGGWSPNNSLALGNISVASAPATPTPTVYAFLLFASALFLKSRFSAKAAKQN